LMSSSKTIVIDIIRKIGLLWNHAIGEPWVNKNSDLNKFTS